MGLWIGNKIPRQLALGSTEAKEVYKGAVKQWERKEEEFLSRVSPATADVVLGTIKGKSLVWNQIVGDSTPYLPQSGSGTKQDGVYSYTGDSTTNKHSILIGPFRVVAKHKILCIGDVMFLRYLPVDSSYNGILLSGVSLGPGSTKALATQLNTYQRCYNYAKTAADGNVYIRVAYSDTSFDCDIKNLMFIDLTKMFGEGNEPATVAEFEAMFPDDYYGYDAGSPLNLTAESIVSNGQTLQLGLTNLPVLSPNIWDEEWEVGVYNISTGEKSSGNGLRNVNPISALPSSTYYVTSLSGGYIVPLFYDNDGVFLSAGSATASGRTFITPGNTFYICFYTLQIGTTYHNDICINVSDASINGTYWPYNPFKDGLKRAGSAYDETTEKVATRRLGVVDLGTLNWTIYKQDECVFRASVAGKNQSEGNLICPNYTLANVVKDALKNKEMQGISGYDYVYFRDTSYSDATTFKSAMNGIPLIYELATPQEFPFSTPQDWTYEEQQGGTVQVTPVNDGTTPATAPMDAIRTYNY